MSEFTYTLWDAAIHNRDLHATMSEAIGVIIGGLIVAGVFAWLWRRGYFLVQKDVDRIYERRRKAFQSHIDDLEGNVQDLRAEVRELRSENKEMCTRLEALEVELADLKNKSERWRSHACRIAMACEQFLPMDEGWEG